MENKIFTLLVMLLMANMAFAQQLHREAAISEKKNEVAGPEFFFDLNDVLPENGELVGYHTNGITHYQGTVKQGKLHGEWNSWYDNEHPLDLGNFKKGVPDGTWKVWSQEGQPLFLRTYSADKYVRLKQQLVRYHKKRPAYPLTALYHSNRSRANEFIKASSGFCTDNNCRMTEKKSLVKIVNFNADGMHYHSVFTQGLLHGLYVNYFNDGSIKDSGYYKVGLQQGLWLHYSPNGEQYWKGAYDNGERHREWKLYATSNDQLLKVVSYKQGKVIWRKDVESGSQVL